MTTTKSTQTNSLGFPLVTCYRCGGTGHYSSCEMYGTVCFGCAGKGVAIRRGKAAKAWAAYTEAVRAQANASTDRLALGDKVAARRPGDHSPFGHGKRYWATVTAVTVDLNHACGWSITRENGGEGRTVTSWAATVTVQFNDGETDTISCSTNGQWNRQPAAVDPAPFLATI